MNGDNMILTYSVTRVPVLAQQKPRGECMTKKKWADASMMELLDALETVGVSRAKVKSAVEKHINNRPVKLHADETRKIEQYLSEYGHVACYKTQEGKVFFVSPWQLKTWPFAKRGNKPGQRPAYQTRRPTMVHEPVTNGREQAYA